MSVPAGNTMAKATIPSFKLAKAAILDSVERVVVPAVTQSMEQERGRFQAYIKQQRFPAVRTVPLSRRYLGRKRALGLDNRVLIATGHYVSSLRVFSRKVGRHGRAWRVDTHHLARARTPDGRVSPLYLQDLAIIHEHGSARANIPARPHWRPFWAQANPRLARAISGANLRALRHVRRRLGA